MLAEGKMYSTPIVMYVENLLTTCRMGSRFVTGNLDALNERDLLSWNANG
jgi:hypothetical protein